MFSYLFVRAIENCPSRSKRERTQNHTASLLRFECATGVVERRRVCSTRALEQLLSVSRLSMSLLMATGTKSDEILSRVIAQPAPRPNVMDLKTFHAPT